MTYGSILKLLLAVAGGNFPIFVVMIPQESGTGPSGSLIKTDPKYLGMLIKFPLKIVEATHSRFVNILSE